MAEVSLAAKSGEAGPSLTSDLCNLVSVEGQFRVTCYKMLHTFIKPFHISSCCVVLIFWDFQGSFSVRSPPSRCTGLCAVRNRGANMSSLRSSAFVYMILFNKLQKLCMASWCHTN